MKKALLIPLVIGLVLAYYNYSKAHALPASKTALVQQKKTPKFMDGDIIFQSSEYGQSKAVQLATGSRYSHVGILFHRDGKAYVLEAVQPVKTTLLSDWIKHGTNKHYVVKRLKNRDEILTAGVLQKMYKMGANWIGKDYDLFFGWSDDRIYCSELVWKLYNVHTGLQLGNLQKLKDFDLTHPAVKQIMRERYGDNIPWEEETISPGEMFDSPLLQTVHTSSSL